MEVVVVTHPLAQAYLTRIRRADTPSPEFRQSLRTLSHLLIYEALRDLPTTPVEIVTPMEPSVGVEIAEPPLLVPVLRAGLGMLEAAQSLLPDAPVNFIGVRRNEKTHRPETYLNTVPLTTGGRAALILDPMLATGGSLAYASQVLVEAGAHPITVVCALASPEGVATLKAAASVNRLVTASIDHGLNDQAFILPGLGDAGDRQFNSS